MSSTDAGVKAPAVKHAPGTGEHALCGLAFDAYQSGDADEPVVFAEPGEAVSCAYCRLQIDHIRTMFRRYRYVPLATRPEVSG